MTPEQISYVQNELARGVAPDTVAATLRSNGYQEEQITALLQAATNPGAPSSVPPTATQSTEKNSAGRTVGSSRFLSMPYLVVGAVLVIAVVVTVWMMSTATNDSRNMGYDAATAQSLTFLRSQAEIYFGSNNQSYAGLCESERVLSALEQETGETDCVDSANRYRMTAELSDGMFYCIASSAETVASTGFSGEIASVPAGFACR